MRRPMLSLAAAVLLAAAPAAEADHTVALSPEESTATIEGGAPGGVNITPFVPGVDQRCGKEPDDYCEFVLVSVTNPVEDTRPDTVESRAFRLTFDVTAAVPGADFDLYVFASDADGARGEEVASSGNLSACAQLCSTPAGDVYGFLGTNCGDTDECVDFHGATQEGRETVWFLAEIVYFASPAGYTAELAYTGA